MLVMILKITCIESEIFKLHRVKEMKLIPTATRMLCSDPHKSGFCIYVKK